MVVLGIASTEDCAAYEVRSAKGESLLTHGLWRPLGKAGWQIEWMGKCLDELLRRFVVDHAAICTSRSGTLWQWACVAKDRIPWGAIHGHDECPSKSITARAATAACTGWEPLP